MLFGWTVTHQWRVCLLVDEAHNLVERARTMYTASLDQEAFESVRRQAPEALRGAFERVHRAWREVTAAQAQGHRIYADLPQDLLAALDTTIAAMADHLSQQAGQDEALQEFFFAALAFSRLAAEFDSSTLFEITRGASGRHSSESGQHSILCLRNVIPGRDFKPTVTADVRNILEGEGCPIDGSPLRLGKAVEIGHIFKLGYRYSESMGARVLDANGKEVMPIMGCYGIGIERILTAIVEQNNDDNGFWLPPQVAPFEIVVVPTNVGDDKIRTTADDVAHRLEAAGFDVLLDDRDERPGVKFKDADLVGIPFRVTVGKKVTEGTVEVVQRSTREIRDASISAITEYFDKLLRPAH